MIGDTMETDILGGVQLGYRTVLALSGGTRLEDIAKYSYRPDVVVDSLADLCGEDFWTDESWSVGRRPDDIFARRLACAAGV
jgi:NagD protein